MADVLGVGTTRTNGEGDLDGLPIVARMTRLFDELTRDPRLANEIVTRPHPLLITANRDELTVVVAPAAVWERGRELLKPFTHRFADGRRCSSCSATRPTSTSSRR